MIVRSLYNTQRQMNVLQKKQENNSANIANVKTPGYKFQQLVQRTMEEYDVHNHAGSRHNDRLTTIGSINFGTEIDGAYTVFDQGNLESTGIYTDLALSGEGFFGVLTEDGQLGLPRNGNFITNEAGELVTQEGYQVLSVDRAGNTTPVVI
ncbi:MAG TPA: flagellar hook-basal body protein, partial [Eubacteriaceae bacterium]|nr:flagellar hook-basal body protein [Eubacteriaceae bacterium]